ncbi:uncharacterized protein LOC111598990 [Drosophila hydei]|uniref:Uncharacterized protein LOC111598990 n=1 Tax=Drosophila hydei TaxID=7224 RepID=A0A6J1LUX7_DROHY|nr:uncharacterized protein LOC111598990 [Drosophila hydei]
MAEQSSAEQLKVLNSKKLELTLDEYYEQHVRADAAAPNTNRGMQNSCYMFNTNIMELTLDEYYEQFVLPKVKIQVNKAEAEQRSIQYQRTHYFGPRYLEQRQPKP